MKNVIKKQHVRVGAAGAIGASGSSERRAEVAPSTPHERHAPAPGVRLVRVGGRISAIEVTCRCGEVSVLELEYADAPTSTESTS